MSGNLIIISVFYAGGIMMQESLLTVGQLSAFLMYAAYVGVSIGGMSATAEHGINRGSYMSGHFI